MHPNTALYDEDFFAWCTATAALIRGGKWQEIDPEALAEEIDSLGKSQRRELEHRLEVLLTHLLKWRYQPERRDDSHSWSDTIFEQRNQLRRLLRDNPSLRPHIAVLLPDIYRDAVRRAAGVTRLLASVFPSTCPWTIANILEADFWPAD
jgi:hypothetical protein